MPIRLLGSAFVLPWCCDVGERRIVIWQVLFIDWTSSATLVPSEQQSQRPFINHVGTTGFFFRSTPWEDASCRCC